MSSQTISAPLLRKVLYANAAFSTVTGLAFLLASDFFAAWLFVEGFSLLGLSAAQMVMETGILLLGFAFLVWLVARREEMTRRWVVLICLADFGWVLGSALALMLGSAYFTQAGFWAELVTAAIVLDFALVQAWQLRRATPHAPAVPAT